MADFAGVLHVHSTFSDGTMALTEIREWAVAEQLDFVCISDHSEHLPNDRRSCLIDECARLSGEVLLLPGIEFAHSGRHVIAFGPDQCLMRLTDEEAVTQPETVRERGGMTIWAHPALTYSMSLRDGAAARYDGWEIWNLKVDGAFPNLPVMSLLEHTGREPAILPFVGWDLHADPTGTTGPRVAVSVSDDDLTRIALLESLRRGDFRLPADVGNTVDARVFAAGASACERAASVLRHQRTRATCVARHLAHRMKTGL
ncbi:MAG: PHP domain-containing protein [Armatimonadota bacterium]|jgi:hypothetical protein